MPKERNYSQLIKCEDLSDASVQRFIRDFGNAVFEAADLGDSLYFDDLFSFDGQTFYVSVDSRYTADFALSLIPQDADGHLKYDDEDVPFSLKLTAAIQDEIYRLWEESKKSEYGDKETYCAGFQTRTPLFQSIGQIYNGIF